MSTEINFFLNDKREEVSGIAPTLTLMNYLRRNKRLTGTKEGCAEGDCGACTVVVGELEGERVRYRAVNACILLVPMLHGKIVLSVESLQGPGGELHPAQQAMVDCHGSQCGFCTPGFIMSLYAAYLSGQKPDRQRINDLLAGNLCRCTGYGPIIEAAERMYDLPRPSWDSDRREQDRERLQSIATSETLTYSNDDQLFFAPAGAGELARLYDEHESATILAGATDVGLWITKQHRHLPQIIYLGRVAELKKIAIEGDVMRIGAGVSWVEALRSARCCAGSGRIRFEIAERLAETSQMAHRLEMGRQPSSRWEAALSFAKVPRGALFLSKTSSSIMKSRIARRARLWKR